jgi:hypothetical protein
MERLRAVHASTQEAKDYGEASPMVDSLKIAGAFSPLLVKPVASFWARNHVSQYLPVNVSTVVSNVAGPNFPLYCAGAKLVDYYGLGVLTPGIALFHLVFSYAGKISVSILADRAIMPDPEFYHDCLVAAYEELYAAASKRLQGKVDKAEIAAKAKISSPKRTRRTGTRAAASGSQPKAKSKARVKSETRAKTTAEAKTRARTKTKARAKTQARTRAGVKPKAKTQSKVGAKARPAAKAKAPATPRLKATAKRKAGTTAKARPKSRAM